MDEDGIDVMVLYPDGGTACRQLCTSVTLRRP